MTKLTFEKQADGRVVFNATGIKFDATEALSEQGTTRTLTGVAIVYGQLSDDRGGFHVRIAPGAAQYADPTLAIYSHNTEHVIGSTANSTLVLTDQPDGVHVQITLPDTQAGRDVYTLVRDGYVAGMSFGTVPISTKQYTEDGKQIVEYTAMLVDEVSVVAQPAFTATSIKAELSATINGAIDTMDATLAKIATLKQTQINLEWKGVDVFTGTACDAPAAEPAAPDHTADIDQQYREATALALSMLVMDGDEADAS